MGKLIIRITGLCAFVPRCDIDEVSKNNQMRLLLVESSRPADLPASHVFHAHEPHVPVLLCRFENICEDPGYRSPDVVYYDRFMRTNVGAFYLEDQDLRIRGAKDNNLEVVLGHNAGSGCHNDGNRDSFKWVTSLARVSPGSAAVPDSCFRSSAVDFAVIARVELREGKICTAQLAYDSDNNVILWEFKVPYTTRRGSRHYQVAADVAEFEVDFPDAGELGEPSRPVELITSLLRPSMNPRVADVFEGKDESVIRLTPRGASIETWIKNMPWADILRTRPPQRYEQEPDVHFSHFYKLSSEYKDVNVPHAHGRCDPQIPLHQGNPNCQPVRTEPNPNA